MFITGPAVIKAVLGEEVTMEELGGAMTHNTKSGVAHFACEDDADCIEQIKVLLSYLPSNNMEEPPIFISEDDPTRLIPELNSIIPDSPSAAYDMKEVIGHIVDDGDFSNRTNTMQRISSLDWPVLMAVALVLSPTSLRYWQVAWISMHPIRHPASSVSVMPLISRC